MNIRHFILIILLLGSGCNAILLSSMQQLYFPVSHIHSLNSTETINITQPIMCYRKGKKWTSRLTQLQINTP